MVKRVSELKIVHQHDIATVTMATLTSYFQYFAMSLHFALILILFYFNRQFPF